MYNDAHFGAPLSTLAAELEAGRSDLRLTLCDKEPKCPAPGAKPYLRRSHYFKKQARSMLSQAAPRRLHVSPSGRTRSLMQIGCSRPKSGCGKDWIARDSILASAGLGQCVRAAASGLPLSATP